LLEVEGPQAVCAAYDLHRIGASALLIFGVLLVVVGLIGYARRPGA
jgi:hypothetical protein